MSTNNGISILTENSLKNGDNVSLSPLGGYYVFRLMNIVGDDVRSIDLTDKSGVQIVSDDASIQVDEVQHDDINRSDGQCMFAITPSQATSLIEIGNFSIAYSVSGVYVTLYRGVFVDVNKKEDESSSDLQEALQKASAAEANAADLQAKLDALQASYDELNTSSADTISTLQDRVSDLEAQIASLQNSMISANIVDEL